MANVIGNASYDLPSPDDDDDQPTSNGDAKETLSDYAEEARDADDVDDTETDDNRIPFTQHIKFDQGTKPLSALGIDHAGARFASGGYDFTVKLWNFGAMHGALSAYRELQHPCEAHNINGLGFSASGENLLIVAGNGQPKVYDREGKPKFECVKGWQYMHDMAATKGHTAMVTAGSWNPRKEKEFITSSLDSTIRIWDMNQQGKQHSKCIKLKDRRGQKAFGTTCCFSHDAKYVVGGCRGGSVQLFDSSRAAYVGPQISLYDATIPASDYDVTSACLSYDSHFLACRCGNDTLQLWDIRNPKKVVHVWNNLENGYSTSECCFSPDDRVIVCSTSVPPPVREKQPSKDAVANPPPAAAVATPGKILFYSRDDFSLVTEYELEPQQCGIRCQWHPRINQLLVTTNDGHIMTYYHPTKSRNGAVVCARTAAVVRKPKRHGGDAFYVPNIITPFARETMKNDMRSSTADDDMQNGDRRERMSLNPRKLLEKRVKPGKLQGAMPPMNGPGAEGRIADATSTLTKFLVKQLGYADKAPSDLRDPREMLLRHAEEAERNPYWSAPAYKKTQPNPIFQDQTEAEAAAAEKSRKESNMSLMARIAAASAAAAGVDTPAASSEGDGNASKRQKTE